MSKLYLSLDVRHARLLALINSIGPAPMLYMFGTNNRLLAGGRLPDQWMSPPASGASTKVGEWNIVASEEGELAQFRLVSGSDGELKVVGGIGLAGADEPMIVDSLKTRRGYRIDITQFTLQEGNS